MRPLEFVAGPRVAGDSPMRIARHFGGVVRVVVTLAVASGITGAAPCGDAVGRRNEGTGGQQETGRPQASTHAGY